MRGVTDWVTDAAVWVTGKVGDLVNATTSPDLHRELVPGRVRNDAQQSRARSPC